MHFVTQNDTMFIHWYLTYKYDDKLNFVMFVKYVCMYVGEIITSMP